MMERREVKEKIISKPPMKRYFIAQELQFENS
jgi:hypothetical protein